MTFEYTGKIIITCNNMTTHGKIAPLLARMFVVNQVATKSEFSQICKSIFEEYSLTNFEEFDEKYINLYTEGLHLRNVLKYCEYIKNGSVRQAELIFSTNDIFKYFEVSQVSSVSQLRRGFEQRFALGRSSFFRYWKKYKDLKDNGW